MFPPNQKPKHPASHEFEDAFRANHGSIMGDCELCGRTIFCNGGHTYGYDEGELEKLQKLAKEKPDKYVEWTDCDGVSFGTIQGMQFVLGCDCNQLRRYEEFVWQHRQEIAKYLMTRIKDQEKIHRRNLRSMGLKVEHLECGQEKE